MNTKLFRSSLVGLAMAALVAAPAAFAETQMYKAALTAANQVPPNASKGTGELTSTYDTATKKFTWTVTYSGLSGPPTAAHFHGPAAAGANAGVVVPQKGELASPMKGEATLTDAQAADLQAGKWYFNIHTEANKGGEIRGQAMKGM
ncbi:MAG: CHRD domain-containing protein [Reyranella sp.]|nr:CHRD domain-containing protein [Reyranella sp.]